MTCCVDSPALAYALGVATLPAALLVWKVATELREAWTGRDYYEADSFRAGFRWIMWVFKRFPKKRDRS